MQGNICSRDGVLISYFFLGGGGETSSSVPTFVVVVVVSVIVVVVVGGGGGDKFVRRHAKQGKHVRAVKGIGPSVSH